MNNRKNSLPALIITILLMLCLLAAGGLFVLPAIGVRQMERTSAKGRETGENEEEEEEDLLTWLGLDTVRTILIPQDPASSATGAFSGPAGNQAASDPTEEKASSSAAADSKKQVNASGAKEKTDQAAAASDAEKKTEQAAAAGTKEKADQPAAASDAEKKTEQAAAASASKEENKPDSSEKAVSEKAVSEKAEAPKNSSGKEAAEKAADSEKAEKTGKAEDAGSSKKAKESEEAGKTEKTDKKEEADSSKTNSGKTQSQKTESETAGEEKKKDPQDSMTKLQKKYVQDWEDFHGRAFPLNATLHNYNWKYLQYDEMGRLHYDGDKHYSIRHGIDVSEFQGRIDWEKVRSSGIDFVFVRAGHRMFESGELVKDTRAVKNLTRAKKAGLEVGVYVFSQAVTEKEAREEAQLCLDVIKESGVEVTLPIVFDPEIQIEYYARLNFIDGEQFTDNTLAFCKAIKKAGYAPAVYANCSTQTDILDMSRLDGHATIWYADYNYIPESPYQFTFWQYSNTGRVEGIPEAETDLNVWFVEKK